MTYRKAAIIVPVPAFRTIQEAQAWCAEMYSGYTDLVTKFNALLIEARKDGSTDLSGTVNSGDADTDTVIEAMRAAMVANGLGTDS